MGCVLLYIALFCGKTVNVPTYYSMQQSPCWEANRFSASQEIPHILWNP